MKGWDPGKNKSYLRQGGVIRHSSNNICDTCAHAIRPSERCKMLRRLRPPEANTYIRRRFLQSSMGNGEWRMENGNCDVSFSLPASKWLLNGVGSIYGRFMIIPSPRRRRSLLRRFNMFDIAFAMLTNI